MDQDRATRQGAGQSGRQPARWDSLIEDSSFAYRSHGFEWKTAFPDILAAGGFDVVLGNPPYVRMELIKPMKPWLEKRYEVVSDRADLYAYFFERGIKLLKPGGRLGFISSSTFFKTGSGAPLRDFLRTKATLETVVDFGDHQIFEGVTTYPAILTMRAGGPPPGHDLQFWKIGEMPADSFADAFADAAKPFPQEALGRGSWELEGDALRALRAKITAGKPTLKEVYGSPLYGIKTGLNDAFVIDTPTKEKLCRDDPRSAELLKPFLEGKDLKRWRAESRGLWIIYIPKNRVRIDEYPAIRDWLLPFKDKLEKRATKQEWFELQQAQEAYSARISQPKISYPHFSSAQLFAFERSGAFSNDKSYFCPSADAFLLTLLNSNCLWFILSNIAPAVRGGFHELRVQYVETLPIPNATDTAQAEIGALATAAQSAAEKRHELQQAITRRIPDLAADPANAKLTGKLKEWWNLPDFAAFQKEVEKALKAKIPLQERNEWESWITTSRAEIHALTAEIARLEAEINTKVYALFDLTPDEIALLEANV
ncbi:Eco57I restriction-modification methylase domain-containing protein [Novosphingobium flavum]|uniref:site-specific DNA-methyltransferase (adenine-specific) n=1 Tax=Novosphingobium flavum TaxID=1778672 RepID=A0A7X1KMS1_9SPHN|nr:Eco57I restriction-modification methylase domain-containing protein [Novosphingobium flavum]